MSIAIRRFRGDDLAGVRTLVETTMSEFDGAYSLCADVDLEDVEAAYSSGAFFVAEADRTIVGTAGVTMDDGIAEIRRMYVDAAHRGRGIGHRLLSECLRVAAPAREIRLVTLDTMIAARHLYERTGFDPYEPGRGAESGASIGGGTRHGADVNVIHYRLVPAVPPPTR